MSRTYNGEIANLINGFLKDDDWNFSFDQEEGIFRFGLKLGNKLRSIRYVIKVNECDFSVYGISPVGPDEEDAEGMQSMAEYLCRVNYGLKSGCFEMDMEDGEIRFRTYVYCKGVLPSEHMIRRSIYTVAAMFEHYGQGMTEVIFGGKSAKEAYDENEKRVSSRVDTARQLMELIRSSGSSDELHHSLLQLADRRAAAPGQEHGEDDEEDDTGEGAQDGPVDPDGDE